MKIFANIAMAILTIGLVIGRYQYPDMTDVRYFLSYWYMWVYWVFGMLAAMTLAYKAKKG